MLMPLNRQKFEQLIPTVSTGLQYRYVWGKLPDFLRRALFSVIGVVCAWFLLGFLGDGVQLVLGLIAGLYWLWGPAVLATLRNIECRRYKYSGLWQGQVLDVFISEELIGKEETVNQRGDLVIIENRERCLNLEVGDETGFAIKVQVPLRRQHQRIRSDDPVQMLVMSNQPDLGQILKVSDVYLPNYNLWVSDYPYIERDTFEQLSRTLRSRSQTRRRRRN
jgi:hypothetical protein